jgi:pimeloyl-[acyl-carrier protein] methyl ester esterase
MQLHKVVMGRGIPIVLIHGFGFNSYIWQTLAMQLESDYRLILIDLPGFGDSPEGSYDITKLSSALLKAVDEPAIWLGWSLGGLVASAVATRYPKQVKKLITVSCNPMFVAQSDWPGIATNEFARFCQLANEQPDALLKHFVRLQCLGEAQQRTKIRLLTNFIQRSPSVSSVTLANSLQLLADYDARPVWQRLDMPQLHIFGDIDQLIPHTVAGKVQQLLPTQQVINFTACGHQPFMAESTLFVRTIRNFIDAC